MAVAKAYSINNNDILYLMQESMNNYMTQLHIDTKEYARRCGISVAVCSAILHNMVKLDDIPWGTIRKILSFHKVEQILIANAVF